MKGVIFNELLDWVEQCRGVEALDEVLLDAELPHGGAYTSAGSYDTAELAAIAASLSRHTGEPVPALLRAYGRHLFGRLVALHPELVGDAGTALDLLADIESRVHEEVRKLHPDAELPRFEVARDHGEVRLDYASPRPFADLAHGLIEGCLAHYDDDATIEVHGAGTRCRFVVRRRTEARCPGTR